MHTGVVGPAATTPKSPLVVAAACAPAPAASAADTVAIAAAVRVTSTGWPKRERAGAPAGPPVSSSFLSATE
jgi:hypothetical protein